MLNSDVRLLLLKLDQSGYEFPDNFDNNELLVKITSSHKELERALGGKLSISDRAQDATFSYVLESECLNGDITPCFRLTFSNFGLLVLLGGKEVWIEANSDKISKICEVLRCANFILLRTDDVSGKYDGIFNGWSNHSWMTRFFSYC